MTGPLLADVGVRLIVGATAIALVVGVDTILGAERIAELCFARFHARGRHVAGVARRQSSLNLDSCADIVVEIVGLYLTKAAMESWDTVLLAASEGLARVQSRVCDDA